MSELLLVTRTDASLSESRFSRGARPTNTLVVTSGRFVASPARLIARAIELFEGDRDAARAWLTTRLRALGGHTPLEFGKTDVGALEVGNLIGRLEHGIPT